MASNGFLYKTLYQTLKARILDNEYPPGSKLPPELALKNDFNVSAITVKKAMSLLVEEQLVRRVPGKGTFVLNQHSVANIQKAKYAMPTIGLLLEHVATPFGLTIMYQIDRLAKSNGYNICIRFSYGNRKAESAEIDFLLSLGVQGLILMPCHGEHYNRSILKLMLDKFPVVLIDKKLTGINIPSVRTDNYHATQTLVDFLAKKGRKNIGYVASGESMATSLEERNHGFWETMQKLGLPAANPCPLPISKDFFERTAENKSDDILRIYLSENKDNLDAVVCATFSNARNIYQINKEGNIIPALEICCIDDDYLCPDGYNFTHMKQDEETIAAEAFSLITKAISGVAADEDVIVPAIFHEK